MGAALRSMEGDVYAFGISLYELATRTPPFSRADPQLVLSWIKDGQRPAVPARVPTALAALIGDCWHQDPAQRPAFTDIVKRLEAMVGDDSSFGPAPSMEAPLTAVAQTSFRQL